MNECTRPKAYHEAGWVCPKCGAAREKDRGPDSCIGMLPGVLFACCGHGGREGYAGVGSGYIYFENGIVVRFKALTSIEHYSPEEVEEAKELRRRLGL